MIIKVRMNSYPPPTQVKRIIPPPQTNENVIKLAVATLKGKMPIIVGTGTIDPNKVLELTQHAKDHGADASLIITPYYVKPPQRALVTHFTNIADKIALPMVVYNCPGRTGVDMKPETVALFAKHPMIVGVKV
jgi:4-hydroxy-tetrahydrodipicolinate synthase